jgi:futalosine hydrolase
MRILLTAATLPEVQPFLYSSEAIKISDNLYTVFGSENQINILIAGAGAIPFLFSLSKYIYTTEKPELIILAGIAGTFRNDLPNGTLVEVAEEIWADTGAEDKDGSFLSMFDLGLWKTDEIPFQEGTLRHSKPYFPDLPPVRSITVNTVTGTQSGIDALKFIYNPDIENMEGAALYYFAGKEGIPCTQIRAISNLVEPRNREAWEIGLAIKNLNDYLEKIRFQFSDFSFQ